MDDEPDLVIPDLAAADAAYEPFPSFSEWSASIRTAESWDAALERLQEVKLASSEDRLQGALDFVTRAAALDTGAIEGLYSTDRGFTYSVAAQAAAWEAAMDERGSDIRPMFEAQLRGYELVLDAATEATPIVATWIRRLHEEFCAAQDTYRAWTDAGWIDRPLVRGQYKDLPNHVIQPDGSIFAYAPVIDTTAEVNRLAHELATDLFSSAHPVVQAAYAHYGCVRIHPFPDGNGRVARALASVFLYRTAGTPLLLFSDRRDRYLDALRAADNGNHQAFMDFILYAAISTLDLATDTMRTGATADASTSLSKIHSMLTTQGGLTHVELDTLGIGLLDQFYPVLDERRNAINPELPPGVTIHLESGSQGDVAIPGFRPPRGRPGAYFEVRVQVAPPGEASSRVRFMVQVSTRDDETECAVLLRDGHEAQLRFALIDVHPDIGTAAYARMRAFAVQTFDLLFADLLPDIQASLDAAGYE
jgi:Fic family protein